jgi:VanZ family protein
MRTKARGPRSDPNFVGMRSRLAAWWPVGLWAAAIFGLSSVPGTRLPTIDVAQSDKIVHALLYAVLGALILRALVVSGRAPGWSNLAIAILLATAYGISDEIHQLWTPHRSADWRDVVADVLGAAMGVSAIVAMRWMKLRGCLMMVRGKTRRCSPTREPR